MSFNTKCPRCEAPEETARLKVIKATIMLQGVRLAPDGYDIYTADHLDSEDELVYCENCQTTFPIEEVTTDGHPVAGEEAIILRHESGLQVRTAAYPKDSNYVRIVQVKGKEVEELAYWDVCEWCEGRECAVDTMGAILGAIKEVADGRWTPAHEPICGPGGVGRTDMPAGMRGDD